MMSAVDLELPLRVGVVEHLRADPDMLALVPAEQIYGRRSQPNSPRPFTRYGAHILLPFRASCISGTGGEITLHAFADGPDETEASRIAATMVSVLDNAHIPLGGENYATLAWTGGETIMDPEEPDLWHAWRTFDVSGVA